MFEATLTLSEIQKHCRDFNYFCKEESIAHIMATECPDMEVVLNKDQLLKYGLL